jgi:hypothetical protein
LQGWEQVAGEQPTRGGETTADQRDRAERPTERSDEIFDEIFDDIFDHL